jgi:uncharacterized protein
MDPLPEAPAPTLAHPIAPAWHTCLYLIYRVVAGWYLMERSPLTKSVPPRSQIPVYLAIILTDFLLLGYVAWGIRLQRGSVAELIGGNWNSARDFLRDCGTAVVFWIAALLILGGVGHLLGVPPGSRALARLIPHSGRELYIWMFVALTAGITEEILYRGYLQHQFASWTKNSIVAMCLSAGLFGVGHLYQGGKHAILMGVFGLLLGYLAERKKSLRPGILAHCWQDAVAGAVLFLFRRHG